MKVIMKHNFSISSILWAKLPFDEITNIDKINPITTIGAISVEWIIVVKIPITIIPIATNAVK